MSEAAGSTGAATGMGVKAGSKSRLVAGSCALALVIAAAPVASQSQGAATSGSVPIKTARNPSGPPRLPDRAAHGPIGEDGLSQDELYLEADTVTRDDATDRLIARGHVLARYQDRTLRADELIYDTETGGVTVNGHAQIIAADGSVAYADHVDLDDKLHAGAATGFAERPPGNGKIAAASAVRRTTDVAELNRAIFTPCPICAPSGRPTSPSWSIQAEKAVQDKTHSIIIYHNATIRVKGLPVFWSPVLWTPDPTSPRQSGLLPARPLETKRLGLSWEQPYLWVISPSEDLLISPQVNTNVNPFLNLDFRKRFYSGQIEARFGYTFEKNFDNNGDKFGAETSRSYALTSGAFDIDNVWRWGFTGEHVSDATLFDRYDIINVTGQRGLYTDDTRRLMSQIFTVRQDSTSFFSLAAMNFQSLRVYTEVDAHGVPVIDRATGKPYQTTENQDGLPNVAPLIEAHWDPDLTVLNGRLSFSGSAVLLERSEASLNPYGYTTAGDVCYQTTNCNGVSDRRVSASAAWRSNYTLPVGVRISPFVDVRGDFYSVLAGIGPTANGSATNGGTYYPDANIGRALADAGVDVSYPLYRRLGATDLILEPMAEFVASPKAHLDPRIPNEDSLAVGLDETNMFRPDRFPGYDLYEGGPRASVGAMATLNWGLHHDARLFLGRAFQSENDLAFPAGSGLRDKDSDWVVMAASSPFQGLNAWTRERFDGQNGKLRRSEAAANWDVHWTKGIVRYLMDDTGLFDLIDPSFTYPATPLGRREEVEAAGYVMATRHWGFVFDATRDLRADVWRQTQAGIMYQDDCIRLKLVYKRDETNPLGTTSSIGFQWQIAIQGDGKFSDNYDSR
jgi:LPS-assembly protein